MHLFGHNSIALKILPRANKGIIIIIIIITIIIIIIIIIVIIIIIIIIVVDSVSFPPYLVKHTLFRTNAVKTIKVEKINNVLTCLLYIFFLLV